MFETLGDFSIAYWSLTTVMLVLIYIEGRINK